MKTESMKKEIVVGLQKYKGDTGPQSPAGPQGPQGPTGPAGVTFSLSGTTLYITRS